MQNTVCIEVPAMVADAADRYVKETGEDLEQLAQRLLIVFLNKRAVGEAVLAMEGGDNV
ncbi:hypothetical protein [Rubellicoccus peritrichatus]|uniref:Uncharacterized protein n=1 Tax=Rubellicoccus peritrichatus TaxID=3080537 RepID=A0AAQ3LJ49_9BACT|nr:hypothetical protein [Puniceicoccus sp. CR14]WOO43114.1 hypothetical protein RZN69_08415 [Puniceicoccus sp. CR14]